MEDLLLLEQAHLGNSQLAVELLALALEPLVVQLDKLLLVQESRVAENNLHKLADLTFTTLRKEHRTS